MLLQACQTRLLLILLTAVCRKGGLGLSGACPGGPRSPARQLICQPCAASLLQYAAGLLLEPAHMKLVDLAVCGDTCSCAKSVAVQKVHKQVSEAY